MASKKNNNVPLAPGTKIARYTIQKKMAAGGFGVVYSAVRDDGRAVAIKEFMPVSLACRSEKDKGEIRFNNEADEKRFHYGLDAFFKEADMLTRIHDERVIAVWDVFKENNTAYFVMPLERGVTLDTALKKSYRPVSENTIREWFIQAAKGIEALHSNGLLHLDIKPANLWLRPNGSVVVLDLGASRWQTEQGRTGQMIITRGFAAPEQCGVVQFNLLSVRTDVYGLAASLHMMLERTSPLHAPERKVLKKEESLLQKRIGQRNTHLLRIVDKGISMDSNQRYKSVREMRMDLEQVPKITEGFNSLEIKDYL